MGGFLLILGCWWGVADELAGKIPADTDPRWTEILAPYTERPQLGSPTIDYDVPPASPSYPLPLYHDRPDTGGGSYLDMQWEKPDLFREVDHHPAGTTLLKFLVHHMLGTATLCEALTALGPPQDYFCLGHYEYFEFPTAGLQVIFESPWEVTPIQPYSSVNQPEGAFLVITHPVNSTEATPSLDPFLKVSRIEPIPPKVLPSLPEPIKQDQEKLQGNWRLAATEIAGEIWVRPASEHAILRLRFDGPYCVWYYGFVAPRVCYSLLNRSSSSKTMYLYLPDAEDDRDCWKAGELPREVVYSLENGRLVLEGFETMIEPVVTPDGKQMMALGFGPPNPEQKKRCRYIFERVETPDQVDNR